VKWIFHNVKNAWRAFFFDLRFKFTFAIFNTHCLLIAAILPTSVGWKPYCLLRESKSDPCCIRDGDRNHSAMHTDDDDDDANQRSTDVCRWHGHRERLRNRPLITGEISIMMASVDDGRRKEWRRQSTKYVGQRQHLAAQFTMRSYERINAAVWTRMQQYHRGVEDPKNPYILHGVTLAVVYPAISIESASFTSSLLITAFTAYLFSIFK